MFGQSRVLMMGGASLFFSFLLFMGRVGTAAANLPGTSSWTVKTIQGQELPPNTIPLLHFKEPTEWDDLPDGTMRLDAVFHPCFDSKSFYIKMNTTMDTDETSKIPVEITDDSATLCPDCTPSPVAPVTPFPTENQIPSPPVTSPPTTPFPTPAPEELITDSPTPSAWKICSSPWSKPEDPSEMDDLAAAAQSFVDALLQVASFTITDYSLELYNSLGDTAMELISCGAESELAGTGWHPYKIYNTKFSVDLPNGTQIQVDSIPDGQAISLTQQQQQAMYTKFEECSLLGYSGCNWYNTDYATNIAADPPEIFLGTVTRTTAGCPGDIWWSIESAFLSALDQYYVGRNPNLGYNLISNATHELLHLVDVETGDPVLSFVPCEEPSVFGHVWETNSIRNSGIGTGKSMKFTFQDNGMLQVQTACRDHEMEYSMDSNASSIIITTPNAWDPLSEMVCDPAMFEQEWMHENAIEEEGVLLDALGDIVSFKVDVCERTLRLLDASGNVVLSLTIVDSSSSDMSEDPTLPPVGTSATSVDGGPPDDSISTSSGGGGGDDPPEDSNTSGGVVGSGLVGCFAWIVLLTIW